MGKEEFKEALFKAIEAFIENRLTQSGRTLIMNYFNDEKGNTTLERAVETMKKYSQKEFPAADARSKKLKIALNRLAYEAEEWDKE
jgi:phosphopantetheinyl transferase (holo-ACP synthase)